MLPTDAKARKDVPIYSGVVKYFPDALAAVAELSRVGNEQHNPGQPLHWDRSKSTDERDALMRHLVEAGSVDSDGIRHSTKVAWRALAALQKELEALPSVAIEEDPPSLNPWRKWEGGLQPPHEAKAVKVRLADGQELTSQASYLRWTSTGSLGDIIAWRPIGNPWRKWEGGIQPPVPGPVEVEVKFRNGDIFNFGNALSLSWMHHDHPSDIVAWRPIGTSWRKWEGGDAPPVDEWRIVEVKIRWGDIYKRQAYRFDWTHKKSMGDIIAWRHA